MLQSVFLHEPTSLLTTSSTPRSTTSSDAEEESPTPSFRYDFQDLKPKVTSTFSQPYKSLAVLSDHVGSVSCLALCGEFILSASLANDIIVWQQPDLRLFTKFGQGEGAVKALLTSGTRVFSAHQDSRIRAWQLSRSPDHRVFRLLDTLPTPNQKSSWTEHSDAISCLALSPGLIYSASWDKTVKVWRLSDFRCLESVRAHDDAINGIAAGDGIVYTASADGRIKAWGRGIEGLQCKKVLEGHKDVSFNAVVLTQDGGFVYGGGSDGSLMGWRRDGWKPVCDTRVHESAVLCLCVMGERMVCSGSSDMNVCVWGREAGGGVVRHMVIEGHHGPVKCLQASPVRVGGGFMLYSGSLDRSIRVWWVPASSYDHHNN